MALTLTIAWHFVPLNLDVPLQNLRLPVTDELYLSSKYDDEANLSHSMLMLRLCIVRGFDATLPTAKIRGPEIAS